MGGHIFTRVNKCWSGREEGGSILHYKVTPKLDVKGLIITTTCGKVDKPPVNLHDKPTPLQIPPGNELKN